MPWGNPSTFHNKTYQLDLGIMAYEPVLHLQRKIVTAKMGWPQDPLCEVLTEPMRCLKANLCFLKLFAGPRHSQT